MQQLYRENPNLKRANVSIEFTKKQIQEYQKCMEDPVYFTESYVKIISLDEGLIPFKLYSFQRQMMWTFHTERFTICKLPRQSGNPLQSSHICYTSVCLILQLVLQYLQTKLLLQETY